MEEAVLAQAAELGVALFLRFRDDVFADTNNPRSDKCFVETFVARAAVFCEVKLESLSRVSTRFLDMVVSLPLESARHLPVAPDSYQLRSVE